MANVDLGLLTQAVEKVESGGRRYDSSGKLLTSSKGAQGEMQVMPATARDPGFGVLPAKDSSPDELARVGRDYLSALVDKYDNVEHALVAYNWGPTNANKWIAAGANKKRLPKETRNYLVKVDKAMKPLQVAAAPSAGDVTYKKMAMRESRPTDQAVEGDGFRGYSRSVLDTLGSGFQAALAAVSLSDDDEETGSDEATSAATTAGATQRAKDLFKELDIGYASPFSPLEPTKQPEVLRMADGGNVGHIDAVPAIGTAKDVAGAMGIISPSNQTVADVLNVVVPGAAFLVNQPNLGGRTVARAALDYLTAKSSDPAPVTDMSSPESVTSVNAPSSNIGLVSPGSPGRAPVYAPLSFSTPVQSPSISAGDSLGSIGPGVGGGSIGSTGVGIGDSGVSAGNEGAGLGAAEGSFSGGDYGGLADAFGAEGGEVKSAKTMRENEARALRLLAASEAPVTVFLPFSSGATEFLGGRLADEAIGDIEAEYQRLKEQVQQRKEEEMRRGVKGYQKGGEVEQESAVARKLREALYGRKGQEMDPYEAEERAYRSSVENTIGFPVPDERREARRLLNYLKSIDFMPTVRESDRGPGGRGHEGPAYTYNNDRIPGTINFPVNSPDSYRSYTHELSHAADRPSRQAYAALVAEIEAGGRDLTEQEKRFVSNFKKLYVTPTEFPLQFREGELLENKRYRSDAEELRAFGSGNMAQRMPKTGFSRVDIGAEFNPHVDPTMATEAAIMREMYRDLYKSRGGVGYAEGGEVADPEEALFAGREDVPAKPRISNEEFIREAIKGAGEYPYLLAGAPVDLATMAMRPFGYDVQKPVMGSEWIKQKATEAGVRPEDTTDPRLQGPRMASEMLFSLMNPASAPRAAAKAVDIATDPKTKEAAKALLQDYMAAKEAQYYAVPGASYAMKPKGGVWLPGGKPPLGSPEGSPEFINSVYLEELTMLNNELSPEKYAAVKQLLESGKVEKYFKNKFATGDDPVRNAMLKGEIPFETVRWSEDQDKWKVWLEELNSSSPEKRDAAKFILEKIYDTGSKVRGSVVVPARTEGSKYDPLLSTESKAEAMQRADEMTEAAVAKEREKMSLEGVPKPFQPPESVIGPVEMRLPISDYGRYDPEGIITRILREDYKNLTELKDYVPPSAFTRAAETGEPIYSISSTSDGFPSIKAFDAEEVVNGLATLTPKQLSKMNFEDALITGLKNRYADPLRFYKKDVDALKNAIRDRTFSEFKPRSFKSVEELYKFGTKPVKLPEGRQTYTLDTEWVQLTDPRATYLEGELMQHSVGGYFRDATGYGGIGAGGREAFKKGDAVIYSLRNKNTGEPRGVTVEVDTTNPEMIVVNQIKGESNSTPISRDKDIFELLYALEKKYQKENPDVDLYVESQAYPEHGIHWQNAYENWRYNKDGRYEADWIENDIGDLEYQINMGYGLGN